MNVASLENCKELFELTRWYEDHDYSHVQFKENGNWVTQLQRDIDFGDIWSSYPAYDLGYLLRKLPPGTDLRHINPASGNDYWAASFAHEEYYSGTADAPEDAACLLATELIKQGVLALKDSEAPDE